MTSIRHLIPLALISTLAAAPADAGYSKTGHPSTSVSYADLDLGSAEGIATLDRRIERAVRKVCGDRFLADLGERSDARKCGDDTMLIVKPQRDRAVAFANSKPIQLGAR